MKYLAIILVVITVLTGCEDTKKQPQPYSPKSEEQKDSLKAKKEASPEEEQKDTLNFPKITQENVVSFLTEYGEKNPETKVRILTSHGNIELELYEDTPLHRANFIYLVKQHYFENTFFHRVVPNFIIQGGNSDNADTNKKRYALGNDYLIPAEINGRNHSYGSVSGAKEYRENPDKKTAPYEFFIFLGPQTSTSHLNGNYTVFARVINGMDVVEKIANLPASEDEWPLKNVKIDAEIIE